MVKPVTFFAIYVTLFTVTTFATEVVDDNENYIVDTICSKSKVAYEKVVMRLNWRIIGMVDYMSYLNKFNTAFEVQSDNLKFKNAKFDGKWTFKLSKEKNQPLVLTATYKYEAATADPKMITFDMAVTVFVDDSSVELPLQISSVGELSNQRQDYRPGVSYQYVFDFVHKFKWADFSAQTKQLFEPSPLYGLGNPDVDLQFFITGYIPKDPETLNINCHASTSTSSNNIIPTNGNKTPTLPSSLSNVAANIINGNINGPSASASSGSEDSNEIIATSPVMRTKRYFSPPFLNQDLQDKYTDLTIKTGEDEYQVHKVILANSSPVFAEMIFNLTFDKNESVLDLGGEIGNDVVEELIRFVYTGKVEAIEEIAERLLAAADKFELPNLKALCESVLIQTVKIDNAIQMYTLANEVKSTKLKKRSIAILKANKSKIARQSEEFRQLTVYYPNLMFELFLS